MSIRQDDGADLASLAKVEFLAGLQQAALQECAERHAWLGALVFEREKLVFDKHSRLDCLQTFSGERDVSRIALDANPTPPEFLGDRARRPGPKEWIEHNLAGIRGGQDDPIE